MRIMTRKAAVYPGTIADLRLLVEIDADNMSVRYEGPYKSKPVREKSGHLIIKLPVDVMAADRKTRNTHYFRVDHIVWALTTGEWPDGWIEHLNGLRHDCTIENLVHLDPDGRRWWWLNGELVEVQGGDTPITYVVTDGEYSIIVPKLVGVMYEEDDNVTINGAVAPRTEGVPAVSEVPETG